MEEKNKALILDLLKKYRQGDYYDYKKDYGYYETKIKKEPTISDILDLIKKRVKNQSDIFKILDNFPDEVIQKYIRAKKLSKIRKKSK